MIAIQECKELRQKLPAFCEQRLDDAERGGVEQHLRTCSACRDVLQRLVAVQALMQGAYGETKIRHTFNEETGQRLKEVSVGTPNASVPGERDFASVPTGFAGSLSQRFGAAPWWVVSVSLHVLAILLASLVTMTIGTVLEQDEIIVVTNIEKRLDAHAAEPEKTKPTLHDILESKLDVQATDPSSNLQSNIVVPPEILAKAEIGDHFETINLDRPDTQSAFGNPDARMFHSVEGNDEPEGGGGSGGHSLMDALIGSGGSVSPGTGDGWGGGNGTGTGVGKGSGHGSFGNRTGSGRKLMVMQHGGNPKTESAVDKALEWLARNQEADGRWDNAKHGGKHNGPVGDVAMTGYAVLAFLGAGHSERVGKYKDNVAKGVAYLIENQGKGHPGRWVPLNYTNGIATMALSEAAAMGRVMKTREAAQKAVDGVDDAQIRRGNDSDREAWDYGAKGGTNDSSIMSWNILGLKSAKVAGLKVDPATFDGAIRWIDAGQDLGNLKPGEHAPTEWVGGAMAYRGTCAVVVKGSGSIAVTAAAALCRLQIGGNGLDHPGVTGPCNMMMKRLPKDWPYNLYYGYYGTLVMFQKGGEHWKSWNEAMKKTLLDAQRKGGVEDGSWDGADTACDESRVMTTALAVMSLEVYYRYLPMFREGGGK